MNYICPKLNFYKHLIILSAIAAVLCNCGANKSASATKAQAKAVLHQTPKIVFLNYSLKKDSYGNKTAKLISSKKVDGTLKNQKKKLQSKGNSEDIICTQFNANSKTIAEVLIKNPLKKKLEYVNESKTLKTALIELDSTQFTVRLQLYPETNHIKLYKINLDNSLNELILTKRIDL